MQLASLFETLAFHISSQLTVKHTPCQQTGTSDGGWTNHPRHLSVSPPLSPHDGSKGLRRSPGFPAELGFHSLYCTVATCVEAEGRFRAEVYLMIMVCTVV